MNSDLTHEYENSNEFEKYYECQKYYIIKENNVFKIKVEKLNNNIIIKCKDYEIMFNNIDLSLLTKNKFNSISESYKYIIDLFEDNNVLIKDIIKYEKIKLILKTEINNKKKDVEVILLYNSENKKFNLDEINNNYNKLLEDIHNIKENIKILSKKNKEINEFKFENSNIKKKEKFDSSNNSLNVNNINYINKITNDSYAYVALDNTFCFFKSINDILFLIYSNKDKSIIIYNLIENKIVKEIKKAHDKYITNFRHYLDIINKRDLIISISKDDNNLKLWDLKNWNLLFDFKNIYDIGCLDSACFLNDNNIIYILTSNSIPNNKGLSEPIKEYDIKGNLIKEIKNSNIRTFFIDCYYDEKLSKNYIITGNFGFSISYDYNENKIYHKYIDNSKQNLSLIVYSNEEITKLIESSSDGNIRIWNFHLGILLRKININSGKLYGICLLSHKYLFVGCQDKKIKIMDLEKEDIIKYLENHDREVISIKTLIFQNNTLYILSQGRGHDQIKLWKIE